MPLVKINILDTWNTQEKEKLNNAIHESLVSIFKIQDWDYNHRIYEFSKINWTLPPDKSDRYVLIEICIFPGRKKATKKLLYREIVKKLAVLGVPANDIIILLIEQPLENWGIRGGFPADEVDLGYKTDV